MAKWKVWFHTEALMRQNELLKLVKPRHRKCLSKDSSKGKQLKVGVTKAVHQSQFFFFYWNILQAATFSIVYAEVFSLQHIFLAICFHSFVFLDWLVVKVSLFLAEIMQLYNGTQLDSWQFPCWATATAKTKHASPLYLTSFQHFPSLCLAVPA